MCEVKKNAGLFDEKCAYYLYKILVLLLQSMVSIHDSHYACRSNSHVALFTHYATIATTEPPSQTSAFHSSQITLAFIIFHRSSTGQALRSPPVRVQLQGQVFSLH
jgi:hypothetical protein